MSLRVLALALLARDASGIRAREDAKETILQEDPDFVVAPILPEVERERMKSILPANMTLEDGPVCSDGFRKSNWPAYLSRWHINISQGELPAHRDECWLLAKATIPEAVGIYWDHQNGVCRALDNLDGLGVKFEKAYPDNQRERTLCLFQLPAPKATVEPAMMCSPGFRLANWPNYLSEWGEDMPKGACSQNANTCWAMAKTNVPEAVGTYWDFTYGYCRAIVNTTALGSWASNFSDHNGLRALCMPRPPPTPAPTAAPTSAPTPAPTPASTTSTHAVREQLHAKRDGAARQSLSIVLALGLWLCMC